MNNQSNQGNQSSFYGLGIAPKIIEILDRMKFKVPTPIQAKAIPIAIDAKDIVGIAQTGTGKTLAFGIPMIQRLVSLQARGLILVPTRELAIQVEETIYKLGKLLSMRTAVLIGGASIYNQIQELRRNPRIIIATPGRLIDHLRQGNLRLDDVAILVLDEADLMLDMGFAPQIDKILQHLPHERQTMLFSATIPERIVKIAASYMKLPVSIEIAKSGTPAEKVRQEVFIIKKEEKPKLLAKILDQYRGAVLVFTRTKIGATRVTIGLRSLGYNTTTIHSRRSLTQRREALEGFKTGKYRILVATDIAARGIDVKGIELVINYDLPEDSEKYVHRIGRTGRAGHEGNAISFATPDQHGDIKKIERLMRSILPITKHTELSNARGFEAPPDQRPRGFHSFYRNRR
ncbi:hypothetical protein A2230_00065 [candidate division WOR-1 bacterium RIFOXYA2_FULL_36_21]|uniref:DEAD/DEAH box helicase n=1 Tax=candidate division WOR-1 bacterium RIFOXYB2_FULL_36_35 TaxID=1802578 RepID=A0A1F4S805_UNCSA|nr:MAG: hypothetical protein A2230_00065 [candidate division WOR-1 bacterium RIFOXYA2_FULL_36_21]OGC14407.1 MAG: hypothetical protein A2282_08155 [candidate division WOR-1 bacterium RIFOXYA12_FULL_36_13]OGC16585.1 MAG: hypothetical protein A2290_06705 [candidate division WOR-1 bacterium RIFOXYB2_FULL_36_35]